jgi:ubiquinol-cytochrome c reductase cytochrome b subunit
MTAWTANAIPERDVRESDPVELQGALVFQYKNCRNCHALDGVGGRRGPDLTQIGATMTRNQLIDQVSNGTSGGGNMPAYGKQMSPAEMDVLIAFLTSLRPEGQPQAGAHYDPLATSETHRTPAQP